MPDSSRAELGARAVDARRPAMGQEAPQAENRLVEMEKRAVGIAALVEQRDARPGDVIGGLAAELRGRHGGHPLVLPFGGGRLRFLRHGCPLEFRAKRRTRSGLQAFCCRAIRVKASLKGPVPVRATWAAMDFAMLQPLERY